MVDFIIQTQWAWASIIIMYLLVQNARSKRVNDLQLDAIKEMIKYYDLRIGIVENYLKTRFPEFKGLPSMKDIVDLKSEELAEKFPDLKFERNYN